MLEDLSQYLLDMAENAVNAGASEISIYLHEDSINRLISISISDNGRGMDEKVMKEAVSPFFTTRSERRVGFGLAFLKQTAESCGGHFHIDSAPGRGTTIFASFPMDHIDCPPLGDMAATVMTLIVGWPDRRWRYRHTIDDKSFELDSAQLVAILGDEELFRSPEVAIWIKDWLDDNLKDIRSKGGKCEGAQDHESREAQ